MSSIKREIADLLYTATKAKLEVLTKSLSDNLEIRGDMLTVPLRVESLMLANMIRAEQAALKVYLESSNRYDR